MQRACGLAVGHVSPSSPSSSTREDASATSRLHLGCISTREDASRRLGRFRAGGSLGLLLALPESERHLPRRVGKGGKLAEREEGVGAERLAAERARLLAARGVKRRCSQLGQAAGRQGGQAAGRQGGRAAKRQGGRAAGRQGVARRLLDGVRAQLSEALVAVGVGAVGERARVHLQPLHADRAVVLIRIQSLHFAFRHDEL